MRKMTTTNYSNLYRDFMTGKQENPLGKDYALGCHEGFEYGWFCGAQQTREMYCGEVYGGSYKMAIAALEKVLKRELSYYRGFVKTYPDESDIPSRLKKWWDYSRDMVNACSLAIFALHEVANKENSKQIYKNGYDDGYKAGYGNAKIELGTDAPLTHGDNDEAQ